MNRKEATGAARVGACLLKVIGGLVLLAALTVLAPELIVPIEALLTVGFHLILGWWFYLTSAWLNVTLEPVLVLNGLLGLTVATLALHWVLRTSVPPAEGRSSKWRWRWTFAIASFVVLLFGVSVSAVGLVEHGSGALRESMQTAGTPGWEKGQRRSSARYLVALTKVWREEAQTESPKSALGFFDGKFDSAEQWKRWATFATTERRQPIELWFLLDVPDAGLSADVPLVYAPRLNKMGLRIVAFGNGEVKELTEPEWEEALTRWRVALTEKPPKKEVPK